MNPSWFSSVWMRPGSSSSMQRHTAGFWTRPQEFPQNFRISEKRATGFQDLREIPGSLWKIPAVFRISQKRQDDYGNCWRFLELQWKTHGAHGIPGDLWRFTWFSAKSVEFLETSWNSKNILESTGGLQGFSEIPRILGGSGDFWKSQQNEREFQKTL